jgi:kynurenine formamidase
VATIEIEESAHADLVAQSSRVTALEASEATAKEALKETNTAAAEALVKSALEAVGITAPKTAARLSAGFPVKENGAIDVEKFSTEITESIAELQVSGGAGTPRGLGETAPQGEGTKVEFSAEDAHKAILSQAGYTPKGAK